MRWRAAALLSLGVNVLLVAVWLVSARRAGPNPAATGGAGSALAGQARTNVVVRRQFFSWQDVESDDYPTYIANLRDIGCPEQTIRDIIIADVNGLYARKRATELITPDQQWWRSEPDPAVLQAAAEKARGLEEDRRALLTRLLGTNWETGDLVSLPRPTRPGIVLDGPVLGQLPADTKQALQDLTARSEERMQAYLQALQREGKSADLVELAKLRQQTREDLARVLSPPALEEFLLRYSQDANNLRTELGQLRYFNATPDEFRLVFRATDTIDQQLQLLVGNDPNVQAQRRALEDARENAIKIALGPDRYQEYRLLHDPLYRQAVATAQQAGTPDAARSIYAINLAAAAQQDSIRGDTNLTTAQKSVELKQLELDQLKANMVASGLDLPPEPPPPPPPVPRRSYVIHPGDTLSVVSLIYGVPVSALRQANPNLDLNKLRPGDSISIPPSTLPPASAP